MNVLLSGPVIAALISSVALLISFFIVHRLTLRREKSADQRSVQREAAAALTEALQEIRRIVERSRIEPLLPRDIADAVSEWEVVFRRFETRIPVPGRHVKRSIAAALGEHFGAVGTSNIFPEASSFEIAQFDPIWWDNADSYRSYIISRFALWQDQPNSAATRPILAFDDWLAKRATN